MTDLTFATFEEIRDEIQRRYPVSALAVVTFHEGAPTIPMVNSSFHYGPGRTTLDLTGLTAMLHARAVAFSFAIADQINKGGST